MVFEILSFVLTHYIAIAILAGLCCGLGCLITKRLAFPTVWERVSVGTGLGLGVIGSFIFILGLLHLLYPAIVIGALVIVGVICVPTLKELGEQFVDYFRVSGRLKLASGIVGFIFLIPLFILPLYPPFFTDATSYHLALAKNAVQSHQVVMNPYIRYPVFPILNEMLFSLSLMFYDDILAQLVQFLMMLLVVAALFAWGRRAFSTHVGLVAGALWLATPEVIWLGASAGNDVGLTLFVTLGVYSFFNWTRGKQKSWLILSGVFIGFAAGSKYSALIFLGSLGLATLYHGILDRKYSYPVIFGLTCACVACPWYLYNWFYSGNPVFPFGGDIFGNRIWSSGDLENQMRELQYWGTGRTLSSFLLLPWNLVFAQDRFHLTEAILLPFYIPALPVAAVVSVKNRAIRGLALLSMGFIVYWFFSAQIIRYLLPILPLLCLLTAVLYEQCLGVLPFLRVRKMQASITALVVIGLLLYGAGYASDKARILGALPVSQAERDAFYPISWIGYDAYKFLNLQKGSDYAVYTLGEEYMAYFADGTFMGDWFGPARYTDITKLPNGETLYEKLRTLKVTHLLMDRREATIKFPNYKLPQDDFFYEHFELVYTRPYVRLYELVATPLRREVGPQLLQNPSFEELRDNQPVDWGKFGTPTLDNSGGRSHTGLTSVQSQGELNAYYQSVPVVPGGLYLLGEFARATEPKQDARLQINWTDAQGKLIKSDIEVVAVSPNWSNYEMVATAPQQAAFAVIVASAAKQGSVWFDDLSFAQVKYKPK